MTGNIQLETSRSSIELNFTFFDIRTLKHGALDVNLIYSDVILKVLLLICMAMAKFPSAISKNACAKTRILYRTNGKGIGKRFKNKLVNFCAGLISKVLLSGPTGFPYCLEMSATADGLVPLPIFKFGSGEKQRVH